MKRLVKGFLVVFAFCLAGMLPSVRTEAKVKVKKVTVKSNYGKMVHVGVGKKIKLTTTVKVTPNKSSYKKVTYRSSNKKIATVTSGGTIKGKKTGSCKITVISKKNKKKKVTIKVKVVKKVTSVKLNVTSLSIPVGNSEKLKKTVLPAAGSYKAVKWTSSNKKIATVTSAGVVKGVAAGTATIKAVSVEGSKKSASCKVQVLSADTVNLVQTTVLSADTIRVSLDRARTLNPSQITIQGKRYSFGKYNTKYTIRKLRNYNNKTYDISLREDARIEKDSFVKVTIASLPGNGMKTKEIQAIIVKNTAPMTKKWISLVGQRCQETMDLSEYAYGNLVYQVSGNVPGITWKQKNNTLIFSGVYSEVISGATITIQATDEIGNVIQQKIQIAVGNESNLVGMAPDMTILTQKNLIQQTFASALGGSGKYLFSAKGMPSGLKVYEDGTITGTAISAGTSDVTIMVVDAEKEERKATFTARIHVADQKKVTGTVVNTGQAVLANAAIICENLEDGTLYETTTDEKGNYTVDVAEGAYNIYAVFAEKRDSVYNIDITTGGRRLDFEIESN